jgi:alkanesulfonate monooxygenase SsuD/methylene tetrahydromethanopterin reductase-like flavin-dependent oxidoreductase (luciferase family)
VCISGVAADTAGVRFGLTVPIFDELADPRVLAELAAEAELAGWDGFFIWDHVVYREPVRGVTDPWIALAAIACHTERITIGPMVTPLARRRPHVVARQLVALDHLSRGRLVFGAGLGLDTSGGEFSRFGEEQDPRVRAAMLDEGLDLINALISGAPVDHRGAHYTASDVTFRPGPVGDRIPVWVAARWPHRRPLVRAARFDGVFVIDLEPDALPEAVAAVASYRPEGTAGFEVVVHDADGSDPRPWASAGATWLLTRFDPFTSGTADVRAVIAAGPQDSGPAAG